MVNCSILGCKSYNERKTAGVSFHLFPDTPELRNICTAATKRKNWALQIGLLKNFGARAANTTVDTTYMEIPVNNIENLQTLQHHKARRTLGSSRQKHTLPDLPYEYSALEPVVSRDIMQLHHAKHHATYINNLNAAEDKLAKAQSEGDIQTIISLAPALRFNGGGHINHSIFWQNLSPEGGKPSSALTKAIDSDFGSFENMKTQLATASVGVQGSGWGWLGYNKQMKKLQIATCQNQDPLQATTGLIPLFGIDVWEHAYYLQYKNVRADYVKAIFDVANWKDVSTRYEKAL